MTSVLMPVLNTVLALAQVSQGERISLALATVPQSPHAKAVAHQGLAASAEAKLD